MWALHLLAMPRAWLIVLLLLVPLAAAHHQEGHHGGRDGGLIRIDLDPDDDEGDREDEDDDKDDEKEEDDREDEGEMDRPNPEQDRPGPEAGQPKCLQVSANATRSGNAIAWPSGQETSIYRATGDGEFRLVHEAGPEEVLFMDRDVRKFSSYRYQATTGDAPECPSVEVTAVPFMSGMAGALAGVAAVAGYAIVRRR